MNRHPATIAVALLLYAACGGDVERSSHDPQGSPDPRVEDSGSGGAGGTRDAGSTADATGTLDAPAPNPCAPENRPICATLRERVVRTDSGECVLYVLHSSADPRPFDPNVLALQIPTPDGPLRMTYVGDALGCSVESPSGVMLGWYFVADPPHLVFCPMACSLIELDPSSVIELLVRCGGACPPP
jgi:hypothetical protein